MPLHSLVGQVEVPVDSDPLEGLAAEVLAAGLVVGAERVVVGSGGPLLLGAPLLVLVGEVQLGDDDVVVGVEGAGSGRVLGVGQELLLQLEAELVLAVGLDRHIGHPSYHPAYIYSRLARLFLILIIGHSLAQLSQEPTSLTPSISRLDVISASPFLLMGMYIFLGKTCVAKGLP